jgi:hypothetical protein
MTSQRATMAPPIRLKSCLLFIAAIWSVRFVTGSLTGLYISCVGHHGP